MADGYDLNLLHSALYALPSHSEGLSWTPALTALEAFCLEHSYQNPFNRGICDASDDVLM